MLNWMKGLVYCNFSFYHFYLYVIILSNYCSQVLKLSHYLEVISANISLLLPLFLAFFDTILYSILASLTPICSAASSNGQKTAHTSFVVWAMVSILSANATTFFDPCDNMFTFTLSSTFLTAYFNASLSSKATMGLIVLRQT